MKNVFESDYDYDADGDEDERQGEYDEEGDDGLAT
jgi:hypothetical protein